MVAEIETDKATMELEAADEGKIEKILVKEGEKSIAVNTPIAILVDNNNSKTPIVFLEMYGRLHPPGVNVFNTNRMQTWKYMCTASSGFLECRACVRHLMLHLQTP